jgi:antitoxin component HigA of HigAB toxin-antitoxin module
LRRIANEAEYRAALARIEELASAEDLESFGEMDALANYVEAWEAKRDRRVVG